MKYSELYRVSFFGSTPDLYLSLAKRESGESYTFAEVQDIAVKAHDRMVGAKFAGTSSIRVIECLSAFGAIIVEEEDFK